MAFDCSKVAAERIAAGVTIGASTWHGLSMVLGANLDEFGTNPIEEAFVLDAITYLVVKQAEV